MTDNQSLFENAFQYASIGMALVSPEGKFLEVNDALCEIVKYPKDELKKLTFQEITHPDDLELDMENVQRVLDQKIDSYQMEKRYIAKDGELKWILLSVSHIFNQDGSPRYFISQIQDISDLKQAQKKLEYSAHFDALTGVANRYTFQKKLQQLIKTCAQHNKKFSLFYIDFDNFKHINDTFGHPVGDRFLKTVAELLINNTATDRPIARLSGDEFIILVMHNKETDLHTMAQEYIELFQSPVEVDGKEIYATATLGVATYPEHGDNEADLLRHADYALYKMKNAGGNGYAIFNQKLADQYERNTYIEGKIEHAIESNEFHIEYQPVIHLTNHSVLYYEALARWTDPQLGMISPQEFISRAEKSGKILTLGNHLLDLIFHDIQSVKPSQPMVVGINISPIQLSHKEFITHLENKINTCQIDINSLLFEFIETSAIQNEASTKRSIHKINQLNIPIAIDDFGTGYASLSYIKSFDVAILKIDKSYIADIETNYHSYEITKAIINLAETLNIKVVAEGIETSKQAEILKDLGCEYGQGFYFDGPNRNMLKNIDTH